MSERLPLRLELRARNNVLWHAIFDVYESVASFCRAHDLNQSLVGGLLNLSVSPTTTSGDYTVTAIRLASVTGISPGFLFPSDIYRASMPKRLVAEVPAERMKALSAIPKEYLALQPHVEDDIERAELRERIRALLPTLSPREQTVLSLRFGLDDGVENTLLDIGNTLGIGQERVRQIEAKAIRKLRHPSRSRQLMAFLNHA